MRQSIAAAVLGLGLGFGLGLGSSVPAHAATEADIDRLLAAMSMDQILALMAKEGDAYAEELKADLLGPAPSAQWEALIATLYAEDTMMETFRPAFAQTLAETDVTPLIAFFDTDPGQKIISLEIAAREAMADPDIEEAAIEKLAAMRDDDDPRLRLLEDFVSVNDLIENNVVGAMNSSFAFYAGLAEGAAFGDGVTEGQILSDVWSQEPEIRLDTIEWIYSYLALAYRPLEDAEIQAYIALSETPEGRDLNRALFGAFDVMYVAISEGLGRGAALLMAGQDL